MESRSGSERSGLTRGTVAFASTPATLRRSMPSLLAALCLAGASSSPAHSAALPSYDVFYGVGIEGYGDQSSQSFGKKSMSNDFGSALAITGTGPSPFVKLELSSSDTSYGAHDASAFGQLGYYLRVTGPAGVSVPVQVSASGSITYSAANANITAEPEHAERFRVQPGVQPRHRAGPRARTRHLGALVGRSRRHCRHREATHGKAQRLIEPGSDAATAAPETRIAPND